METIEFATKTCNHCRVEFCTELLEPGKDYEFAIHDANRLRFYRSWCDRCNQKIAITGQLPHFSPAHQYTKLVNDFKSDRLVPLPLCQSAD